MTEIRENRSITHLSCSIRNVQFRLVVPMLEKKKKKHVRHEKQYTPLPIYRVFTLKSE